jgi:hypothetical protein
MNGEESKFVISYATGLPSLNLNGYCCLGLSLGFLRKVALVFKEKKIISLMLIFNFGANSFYLAKAKL